MSHILLTQVKDGKFYPMVVRVASLDYSNQSAHSPNQFINISDGIAAIEVKESAQEIFEKIKEQQYNPAYLIPPIDNSRIFG